MKLNAAGKITEKTLDQAFDFWRHKIPGEETINVSFLAPAMVKEFSVDIQRVNKVIHGMMSPVNGEVKKDVFVKFCLSMGPWDKIFRTINDQLWDPRTNDVIAWFHGEIVKTSMLHEHGQYLLRYAPQRAGLNLSLAKGEIGKTGVNVKNHLLTSNCRGGWVTEQGETYFSLQEFKLRNNLCEDLLEPVIRNALMIGLHNQSEHKAIVQCTSAHKFEAWQQKEVPARSSALLQSWPGRHFTVQLFNQTAGSFVCGNKATGLTLTEKLHLNPDNVALLQDFKSTLQPAGNEEDFEVVDQVRAAAGSLADLKIEDPRVLLELGSRDLKIKNLTIQLAQMTALLAKATGGNIQNPEDLSTVKDTFSLLRSLEAGLMASEPTEEKRESVEGVVIGGDGHSLPSSFYNYPAFKDVPTATGTGPDHFPSQQNNGRIVESLTGEDVIRWLQHATNTTFFSPEMLKTLMEEEIDGKSLMCLTNDEFKNLGFNQHQIVAIRDNLPK